MTVEDLKKYKDNLYGSFCRDLTEFEKNFLLISGGILAFSITFIKDIVKIESAKLLPVLFLGWFFIILAIGLMMFTFLMSAGASDKLWATTDNFILEHQLFAEKSELTTEQSSRIKSQLNAILYVSKKKLKALRYYAVTAFMIGLILFALFVGINLRKEKKLSTREPAAKNQSIKIDSLEFVTSNKTLTIIFKYANRDTTTR